MSSQPDEDVTHRLAVDVAVLTVREEQLQVLLVDRDNVTYRGKPALPGGYLRDAEEPKSAGLRGLREEAGVDGSRLTLEQLPVFGVPDRDPGGRVVSVPYLAIAPDLPLPASSGAREPRWAPVSDVLAKGALAPDHSVILSAALEEARTQLEYTTVAAAFCGEVFTIGDLRHVYEVVWGVELDAGNFSRKVTKTEGFIVPTDEKRAPSTGRPAALYRRGSAVRLHPPMLRGADIDALRKPAGDPNRLAQPGGDSLDNTIRARGGIPDHGGDTPRT